MTTQTFVQKLPGGKQLQINMRHTPRGLVFDSSEIYDPNSMPVREPAVDSRFGWARDWALRKGLSEADANEFVAGLRENQVYHADQAHGAEQDQPPAFRGRPNRGGEPLPLGASDDSLSRLHRMLASPDTTSTSLARLHKQFGGDTTRESIERAKKLASRIEVV